MALNSTFNPIAPWNPVLPIANGDVVTWNDTLQTWTNSTGTPGSGDVTASGVLALNAVALGGGGAVIKTTTTGTGVVTLIAGNATGTGALVGSNSPTFVDDFDLGAAGVRFTGAAGVLTLLGLGAGADESLTIDLDGAGANTIAFGTGSGVTTTVWPFIQQLGGTAGVALSAADGVLTILGLGNGADESLTIDLDNAGANTIAFGTGTGATTTVWPFIQQLGGTAGVALSAANGVLTLLGLGSGADESLLIDLNTTANAILLSSGSGVGYIQSDMQLYVLKTSQGSLLTTEKTLEAGADPGYQASLDSFMYVTPQEDQTGTSNIYGAYNQLTTGTAFDIYVVIGTGSDVLSSTASGSITAAAIGVQGTVTQLGTGTLGQATGFQAFVDLEAAGTITDATDFYAYSPVNNGGTITNYYAFYSQGVTTATATNPYFLWYDGGGGDANGGGVFRVNHLGILAYYNPAFTTYTPGSVNFERELIRWGDTGVFGTDNIAYIGVEAGGTGTNRNLNILGAEVGIMTIPGTYGVVRAGGYKSSDGSAGTSGTATAANTLTIKNGLVTVIA